MDKKLHRVFNVSGLLFVYGVLMKKAQGVRKEKRGCPQEKTSPRKKGEKRQLS